MKANSFERIFKDITTALDYQSIHQSESEARFELGGYFLDNRPTFYSRHVFLKPPTDIVLKRKVAIKICRQTDEMSVGLYFPDMVSEMKLPYVDDGIPDIFASEEEYKTIDFLARKDNHTITLLGNGTDIDIFSLKHAGFNTSWKCIMALTLAMSQSVSIQRI